MEFNRLGSTGLQVSRICLGTMSVGNSEEWMVEIDKAKPIVKRALDLGVNFFDTANVYSDGRSEEIVGELLKDHRDSVVIASKVRLSTGEGPNKEGLSRYHIIDQARKSLKRLKTDKIDLYQTHRWDYSTPIEETLVAAKLKNRKCPRCGSVMAFHGGTAQRWSAARVALLITARNRLGFFDLDV